MITIILVIHLLLAFALIVTVLLQRSEGGALGIGGGGGSGGFGLMSARGTANLLTRATAVIAACFIATSLLLAILAGGDRVPTSIFDQPATEQPQQPAVPLSQ
jgi:preprotein translocase subunit SecG